MSLAIPNLDPTDAIIATRTGRTKYGYYVNFEQSLTEQLAIFGRWSWNDGRNEISAFTDIDRSLMFGAAITGKGVGAAPTTGSELPVRSTPFRQSTATISQRADWEF